MSRFYRAGLPSPKSYLAGVRVLHAAYLFQNLGLSVADVAYRLDYSSPQSFSRHVNAMLGVTAGEFRFEQTQLAIGGYRLLSLRRQRRHPAIGRIDNQRRSRPGALAGYAYRIVGAGDIGLGSVLRTHVRERCAPRFVQLGSLCFGEKFLVRIFGRALQGRIKFCSPNSL